MPVIPVFTETKGLLPESPTATDVNPEKFGKDAAALAKVGGELGDIGSRLLVARKKVIEDDAVFNRHIEDSEALTNKINEEQLKIGSKGEDGLLITERGFAERVSEWGKQRMAEGLDLMPTGDAQQEYQARTGALLNSAYVSNSAFESRAIRENAISNLETGTLRLAADLEVNPDDHKLSDAMAINLDRYRKASGEDGMLSVSEAEKSFRKSGNNTVHSYINGNMKTEAGREKIERILNAQEAGDPNDPALMRVAEGDSLLNHPERFATNFEALNVAGQQSYLSDFLDPQEIKQIRNELAAKREASNHQIVTEANRILSDSLSKLDSGDLRGFSVPASMNALSTLDKYNPKDKDGNNRKRFQVVEAFTTAGARNSIEPIPFNQVDKLRGHMEDSVHTTLKALGIDKNQWAQYENSARNHLKKSFEQDVSASKKQWLADPAKKTQEAFGSVGKPGRSLPALADRTNFGTDGDPALVNEYFRGLEAAQRYKGLSNDQIKLLHADKANAIGKELNAKIEAGDTRGAGERMLQLQNLWGKDATRNFNQISSDKETKHKLPAKYLAALHVGNVDDAGNYIDRLHNPDADQLLEKMGRKEDSKLVEEAVPAELDKYIAPGLKVGDYATNDDLFLNLSKNVEYRAKRMVARGATVEQAVRESAKMFGQSYGVVGDTMAPRRIGNVEIQNHNLISAEMQYRASKEYVMANIDEPLTRIGAPGSKRIEQILEDGNKTRWNMLKDGSGARLEVYLKNDNKEIETWTPIYGKDKQPITIDYIDVGGPEHKGASKEAIKYLDRTE